MISDLISSLTDWGGWGAVGATLAWVVTSLLLAAGIAGCIVPALPGHLLILLAAIAHHLMLGSKSGVDWWTYAVLGTCLIVSQVLEFMSGAAGSRWFGGHARGLDRRDHRRAGRAIFLPHRTRPRPAGRLLRLRVAVRQTQAPRIGEERGRLRLRHRDRAGDQGRPSEP